METTCLLQQVASLFFRAGDIITKNRLLDAFRWCVSSGKELARIEQCEAKGAQKSENRDLESNEGDIESCKRPKTRTIDRNSGRNLLGSSSLPQSNHNRVILNVRLKVPHVLHSKPQIFSPA